MVAESSAPCGDSHVGSDCFPGILVAEPQPYVHESLHNFPGENSSTECDRSLGIGLLQANPEKKKERKRKALIPKERSCQPSLDGVECQQVQFLHPLDPSCAGLTPLTAVYVLRYPEAPEMEALSADVGKRRGMLLDSESLCLPMHTPAVLVENLGC